MSMPKTPTHVVSTSRKHMTGFLVKRFGGCCRSTELAVDIPEIGEEGPAGYTHEKAPRSCT